MHRSTRCMMPTTNTRNILQYTLSNSQQTIGWDVDILLLKSSCCSFTVVFGWRRSGAELTCCFTTRFFTPSMTSWEPVFITLENSLRKREEKRRRGDEGGEGGKPGQRRREGTGGEEEEVRVRLVVLNQN